MENQSLPLNQVVNGDCLEVVKAFPENSIDSIITDPPYHLKSIVERFGKKSSAPARYGKDGSFARLSGGFMGMEWDGGDIAFRSETWAEFLRVAKPGAALMSFGGTRTFHRIACAIEDAGWVIYDTIMWVYLTGMPKSRDIGKDIDRTLGFEREVIETRAQGGAKFKATQELIDNGGFNDPSRTEYQVTAPASDEAKMWDGYGTGLSPAFEPIIVARKPVDETYAKNALKWGVAGLNINEGRLGRTPKSFVDKGRPANGTTYNWKNTDRKLTVYDGSNGAWPKNVILSEEFADAIGDLSNFFYCPKPSIKEKEAGLKDFVPKQVDPSRLEGNPGGDNPRNRGVNKRKNTHPSVKPIKLLEYLVKLTKTPTGGIVLDPFAGSGTTGVACKMQGRPYILIDQSEEYCKIAEVRIAAHHTAVQASLFDI